MAGVGPADSGSNPLGSIQNMARTTPDAVNDILDTTLDDAALSAFIDAASDIVDDIQGVDPTISGDRLERIEKFYAAYLATAQDPRASSQSAETRSVNYRGVDGDGNASYWQVAVSLDPAGVVASAGKRTATLSVPDARGLDR